MDFLLTPGRLLTQEAVSTKGGTREFDIPKNKSLYREENRFVVPFEGRSPLTGHLGHPGAV